ncbi:hypothetical protein ABPG77_000385 [Micractinium sp. CCAP 211/92]
MAPPEIEEQSGSSSGATGDSGRAPPAGAAAPSATTPGPPQKLSLLLHQAIVIFAACVQMAITSSQWRRMQALGRLQTVGLILMSGAVAVFAIAFPSSFYRHRILVLSASRLALYSVPSFRSVGVGSALVLERAARAGWRGALADLGRVGVGTRALGLGLGGVLIPSPPAITLAMQLTLLKLTMTPDYCSTTLMTDGLTQRRAAALAALLQRASAPVLAAVPPALSLQSDAALLRGSAPTRSVCLSTLTFLQLTACVVGPGLLSVYSWQDPGPPERPSRPVRWHQRLRFWAACAEHASSRALCWLLHSPAGGLPTCLAVAWWLLVAAWFVSKRLAGLA